MREIKDFIYLDMDKVSSLYSQLTGGIIQRYEVSSVSSGDSRNLRNYDFKIFKHEAGSVQSDSQAFTETRVSHHDLYNELENKLFADGYAAEIGVDISKDQIISGDATEIFANILCVRAEGWSVLEDYTRMSRIADNYNEIALIINKSIESTTKETEEYKEMQQQIEQQSSAIKTITNKAVRKQKTKELKQLTDAIDTLLRTKRVGNIDEWIIEGMKKWIDVFLPRIFNFRLYPFEDLDSFHILSNLKKEFFLDNDTESLHFLYGSKPTVKLSMLGIVTSVPPIGDNKFDPMTEFAELESENKEGHEAESIERGFRGVFRGFDGFEKMVRTCRYPRLMVHPIAIYRSIKPNEALQRTR